MAFTVLKRFENQVQPKPSLLELGCGHKARHIYGLVLPGTRAPAPGPGRRPVSLLQWRAAREAVWGEGASG